MTTIDYKKLRSVAIDDIKSIKQGNPLVNNSFSDKWVNTTRMEILKFLNEEDLYLLSVGNIYNFRLDIISTLLYGSEEYINLILKLNSLNSIMDFLPENLNNQILIIDPESLSKIE